MLSNAEYDRITEEIFRFHTKRAPGIPVGVAMVDLARDMLGPITGRLNAISETQSCLTDVIQVMTGCTIGNRYLKVMKDIGRYALVLYDRETGLGVRVYVDISKIDQGRTPELYKFFRRERGEAVEKGGEAREASGRLIMDEFRPLRRDILGIQRVKVLSHGKPRMLPAHICSGCGESYLRRDDAHTLCDACGGSGGYFEVLLS